MNLSYCILAEDVKKEIEAVRSYIQVLYDHIGDEPSLLHPGRGCQEGDGGCGIPYPGTLKMNLSHSVKKETEAVGSHIQVCYR